MQIQKIGFIGTGVMGNAMVRLLLKCGHSLYINNRTKSKATDLVDEGALWCDSPGEIAEITDIVITCLGYPADVESIYLSKDGLINSGNPGLTCIDMTTSDPELAIKIFKKGKSRGIQVLDAPVTGGDIGARKGTLSILVGGESSTFQAALPIFDVLGSKAVLQGPAGSGQHTKMVNQIAIAANMVALSEALNYAKDAGLDQERVLTSIAEGAAGSWSMNHLAPRIIKGDNAPGFYIKHFVKDMNIAAQNAKTQGTSTPGLELALSLYKSAMNQGGGELGTQALHSFMARDSE